MKKLYLLTLAAMLSFTVLGQNLMKSTFQGKHHMMSVDELGQHTKNSKSFVETAPPTGEVRPIGEFEPNEAVLVAYMTYGGGGYFGIPVDLIASMSEVVTVITICDNSSQEADVLDYYNANGVNTSNCDFLHAPTDSYWTRDFSPIFISVDNEVAVVDFPYNRPMREDDDEIPIEFASAFGYDLYGMDVMHTGGNYMTDGVSVGASTDLVEEENTDQTLAQINTKFEEYLGITNYHHCMDPLGDYIKHIDCWGKFLDVDKIIISQVPSSNSQYDEFEETADYWANQISPWGNYYQVYRVYSPNGQPYTNCLILNDRVFLAYADGSAGAWNDDALETYQAAMPGYEIIGFEEQGGTPWQTTDALHCRTHEVPDRGMLYIGHFPTLGSVPYASEYPISAEIVPYSGGAITSAVLRYQVDGGSFTEVPMTNTTGDTWEASIPELPGGSEVGYYIHAEDNSPRTANHPFIGEPDPHIFNIESVGISGEELEFFFRVFPNPTDRELFVNIFSDIHQDVFLKIVDMTGKTIHQEVIPVHPGNVITPLDVSTYSSGIYFVHIQYGDSTISKKVSIK